MAESNDKLAGDQFAVKVHRILNLYDEGQIDKDQLLVKFVEMFTNVVVMQVGSMHNNGQVRSLLVKALLNNTNLTLAEIQERLARDPAFKYLYEEKKS